MDEIRLWNVARNAAEIQENMTQPLTNTPPGLVAYYRFDEGAGTTTADATGHGYSGTLVNGPAWVTSRVPQRVNVHFRHLSSAQAIHDADPTAPDGEYLITNTNGQTFAVYCHDMAGTPREYLTLVYTDGTYNYAMYSAGGSAPGTDVRTYYYRLRMNPQTLVVDTTDRQFSASTGSLNQGGTITSWNYGHAHNCCGSDCAQGSANINLIGTPFAVTNDFVVGGYNAWGYANKSAADRVVDIRGKGWCGGTTPSPDPTRLQLRYAPFTDINAGLPGVAQNSVAWGDYDNDGRLDFLLTGQTDSGYIAQVWRNCSAVANTAPAAPTGLTTILSPAVNERGMASLSWNAASDGQTSANTLTYNLRVGTSMLTHK